MAEAKKQRVIDDNMHFLPTDLFTNEKVLNGFLYSAPITMGVKAYLDKTPDGTKTQVVLATDSGEEILNYVEGDYTLETKIQAMDDAGVDIAMLRMPVWQEWLPLEICKIVNDQAADMCKRSEGRLVANAVVPPYGRPEDIAELKRCVEELGMIGVQFACAYGNKFLDDELFAPMMKVLNEMKLPAVVHHTPARTASRTSKSTPSCVVSSAASPFRQPLSAARSTPACSRSIRTSSSCTRCSAATGSACVSSSLRTSRRRRRRP